MSANRWYKDSTLARDCQGCTSKIHALAIACRKIPHTIGNKAAAREIPARPVTPHPSRKASGFPQAQRGGRPRPGHPTQIGRTAVFRRHVAGEGLHPAPPSRKGVNYPQARREKRPPFARRPPKPEGRQFSAGTTWKKTPLCSHSKKKAPGKARFPQGRFERKPRLPWDPPPNQKGGNFPQAQRGRRLPPALSPPPKPEGRRLCRVGGLSPPAPAGSGPRRPGCWRGSRRWRPP